MRKLLALVLVASSFSFAAAQTRETFEKKDLPKPLDFSASPVEVDVIENGWDGPNSPYQTNVLTAMCADWVVNLLRAPVAADTAALLNEAAKRDAMFGNRWINQGSRRLTLNSQEPGVFALEIYTGGTPSNGQRQRVTIGGFTIQGEFGSAEAIMVVQLRNLVSNTVVASFVARSKRSSLNIEAIRASRTFHGFRLDDIVNWNLWDTNHDYRREMLAVLQVLEDARAQIAKWPTPA